MARAFSAKPLTERIKSKVQQLNGCWVWSGRITYQGYGQISVGSRADNTRANRQAHVVSYETFVGKVPKGLQLDHLCRNRACVNPDHLEPVTAQENVLRSVPYRDSTKYGAFKRSQTHCKNGHEFDYISPIGKRGCRTCRNATAIKWQLAKKERIVSSHAH